jgi:hypothetical protein
LSDTGRSEGSIFWCSQPPAFLSSVRSRILFASSGT